MFLFRLLTIIIHVYTQFNTLSFCIDVDDSYITYIGGFKVNMSVNDFYLLMRTKHVFCFFNCLFKPTLVYHISLKAWFYCILYGSSLWRIFLNLLLSGSFCFEWIILLMLKYVNHSNSRSSTWVELHFLLSIQIHGET